MAAWPTASRTPTAPPRCSGPPDLRDGVAEDDLVPFVIQAVERLPLSTFALNPKGPGDAQYPPHLLLALLIYCYAHGVFSSRRIEPAACRDIAGRSLAADSHPDHVTICACRRNTLEAIAPAFGDVLELAQALQLLQPGTVRLEGTHIRASASKDPNVTRRARPATAPPTATGSARTLATRRARRSKGRSPANPAEGNCPARTTDEENGRGLRPARITRPGPRRRRPRRLRSQRGRVRATRRLRQRSRTRAAASPPGPDEQINLTDPDARLMCKNKRKGYTQSHHAPAVVDAGPSRLIMGQRVRDGACDAGQLEPDLPSIAETLDPPEQALADGGDADKEVFQRPGAGTIEPVLGILTAGLGCRQLLLRGLRKVSGEWNQVCLADHLQRLHRRGAGLKLAATAG